MNSLYESFTVKTQLQILGHLALTLAAISVSAQAGERREWNQKKAEKIVKAVVEKENKSDFGWDQIKWNTDAEKAAKLAHETGKPIFVYFYLKKDVGPKAAPC